MNERKIELGDIFYVFTNWGICKGRIVRIEHYEVNSGEGQLMDGDEPATDDEGFIINEFEVTQYKLNIYLDECNKNLKYGFWYSEDQLFNTYDDAINFAIANKHVV